MASERSNEIVNTFTAPTETNSLNSSENSNLKYHIAKNHKKSNAVFFSQIFIIFTVIISAILNLSLGQEHTTLWTSLLSTCIGLLLPNPSLKRLVEIPPARTIP